MSRGIRLSRRAGRLFGAVITLSLLIGCAASAPSGLWIVGFERNDDGVRVASLWENGVPTQLSDGTAHTIASRVAVTNDGTVYVLGQEVYDSESRVILWTNGEPQYVSTLGNSASPSGLWADGDDLYLAYTESTDEQVSRVVVLQNGGQLDLDAIGVAHDLIVDEGDVYVAGTDQSSDQALITIWTTASDSSLPPQEHTRQYSAMAMGADGLYSLSNYTAFRRSPYLELRLNGDIIDVPGATSGAEGNDIIVHGDEVIIVGENSNTAAMWLNGSLVQLETPERRVRSVAYAASRPDDTDASIYVVGSKENSDDVDVATLWIDGTRLDLSDGTRDAEAIGVLASGVEIPASNVINTAAREGWGQSTAAAVAPTDADKADAVGGLLSRAATRFSVNWPASSGLTLSDEEVGGFSFDDRTSNHAHIIYHPINMFDGNPATAWTEGVDGPGDGAVLRMVFDQDSLYMDEIRIAAGYFKPGLYEPNGRVRQLTIAFFERDDASAPVLEHAATLEDVEEVQAISLLEPVQVRAMELRIDSVYPGSRYEDTCISELEFFLDSRKIDPELDEPERIISWSGYDYEFRRVGTFGLVSFYPYGVMLESDGSATVSYDTPDINPAGSTIAPAYGFEATWQPGQRRGSFVVSSALRDDTPESQFLLRFFDPFTASFTTLSGAVPTVVPSEVEQRQASDAGPE